LVEGFKRIVERDKVPLGPPAMQNSRPDGLHIPIALLRSISRVKATSKRAKVTANFLSAALHIAFLRSAASKNGLHDLPESAQALMIQYENSSASGGPVVEYLISSSTSVSQFTQEDQEFLRTFDSREAGLGGLRNHLHLATAISPLYLLLPKDLSAKNFHRQTLMEVIIWAL